MPLVTRTRLAVLLAATLLAALLAPPSHAAYQHTSTFISSADGTPLHADVFRPVDGPRKVPVVLLVSPYLGLGTKAALAYEEFGTLIERGYAVVQVSFRGFGASGGCGDLGGKGEQADAKAAVEWSAAQKWSTGRVGMWGVSYDAWAQVMALATKPRGLAAAIIQSPLTGLYRGLYMNGAHYGEGWWATPAAYAGFDAPPPHPGRAGVDGVVNAATGTATGARCYADNLTSTVSGDQTAAYWKERDLVPRARTSTVPVLWSHGYADVQTKPDNLTSLYPLLRGPKRAWVGQFGHSYPRDAREPQIQARYIREAFDWLDAYVKRDPAALRRVARQSGSVVQQEDARWRTDTAWPPKDSRGVTTTLRSGTFLDDPNNDGSSGHEEGAVLWSFSQPLPYDVHLSGVVRVTLTAKAAVPAQVVVKVYEVEGEGDARMVTRGIHTAVAGKVSFDLYPQDWRFRRGHRIGVAVLGSDGSFWHTAPSSGQVAISGASLTLPALRYDRDDRPFISDDTDLRRLEFTVATSVMKAGSHRFRLPPRLR